MAIDLFDGSDEADLSTIKVDQNFAKRLEHNKRREARHRLEELKRKGLAADSDTSDESEDDDDVEEDINLPGKNDLKFFETLVRVKKNDPEIFRSDAKIYSSDEEEIENGEDETEKRRAAKKERPLYLKDVNARHLIEEGPEFEDEPLKYDSKVYNEEQAEGIKAFMEAEKAAFASLDEEDDILKVKEKPGEAEKDEEAEKMDHNLNEYFGNDDDLSENEKFLKEYLRNRMWIDEEKDKNPSFNKLFDISDEEDELDKQDKYEAEYNFRFEEGGADRVLGHSRVVEGSVRKKTNSRKLQRKSKEDRMAQAEFERNEELKHLKNLKKKEIQEKLEKIRAIAGIGDGGPVELDEDDLEEEFDPEEYDKKMKEMFGDDYYDAEDIDPGFGSQEEGDLEKPDFDKEDELLGLPKGWDGSGKEGFEAARERFLKHRHVAEEEEPEQEDGERKRKRKISLKEKVELDKELEEYYKLDYEDTIGDLKTRFKYRAVLANRYGLHPEEMLMANEKDLNQYVSLKRLAPYREKEWKVTYHQKLKKDLILQGESSDQKKKLKSKAGSREFSEKKLASLIEKPDGEENKLSRRSRRRHRQAELKLSHSRLLAYGKITSKHQKKHS